MTPDQMITYSLNIVTAERIEDAPNYDDDVTMLKLDTAIVVRAGTVEGKTTIDLQMRDANGKEYLVMTTGKLLQQLGRHIQITEERTE
ncbi:TPA: hypothetical protein NGR52_004179 [Vibrio parahaemolyticus]|nr:hypothetical protein [Vibrio parahaemolyticus]